MYFTFVFYTPLDIYIYIFLTHKDHEIIFQLLNTILTVPNYYDYYHMMMMMMIFIYLFIFAHSYVLGDS